MATRPKLIVNIREKDLGMSHFLREAAKIRKKPFVKVGVTQAKGSRLREDGKKTVADVAVIHEYGAEIESPTGGTIVIPERSFIRSTVSKNQARYDAHIEKLRDQIFDANAGMTTERALGLIGQEVTADMKNTIRNNEAGLNGPTPLKPATILRKNRGKSGTSVPLIDTAQMINSLNYEVNPEGDSSGEGRG